MVDHRAGDGDTLLLSAGKLRRSEIDTIPESHSLERFRRADPPLLFAHSGVAERKRHIFHGALPRHQLKTLEHEPDAL